MCSSSSSKKASFSAKKKVDNATSLPPIENEPVITNYLKKSLDSSSVTSSSSDLRASLTSSLKTHLLSYSPLNRNLSTESDNIDLLPSTENKKRAPNQIQSIDPNIVRRIHSSSNRNLQEPLIIDILSESGRFSKQSLDPLTNRDSTSRKSSVRCSIYLKFH